MEHGYLRTDGAQRTRLGTDGKIYFDKSTYENRGEDSTSNDIWATLNLIYSMTTYHYRVKSRDTSGNLTISPDYTFATAVET